VQKLYLQEEGEVEEVHLTPMRDEECEEELHVQLN
jgi:hypothetical protein